MHELVLAKAEGNAFFIEEIVQALVEQGALEDGPRAAVRLPASVQEVLAARIDRLDPPTKALLQTLAVVGRTVGIELAREVAGEPDEELRAPPRRAGGGRVSLRGGSRTAAVRLQARAHPGGRLRARCSRIGGVRCTSVRRGRSSASSRRRSTITATRSRITTPAAATRRRRSNTSPAPASGRRRGRRTRKPSGI